MSLNSLSEDDAGEHQPVPVVQKIITIVLADDHALFREGVKAALSHKKDIQIIGEAENGLHLLHLLKHMAPDVILLDIQMPIMDGIAALSTIRKLGNKNLKIIMLSMHNEASIVSLLMATGANGYLNKNADSESIYEAIKCCHEKSYYFNDLTNMSMLEKIRSGNKLAGTPTTPIIKDFRAVNRVPEMPKQLPAKKRHGIIRPISIIAGFILLAAAGAAAYSFFRVPQKNLVVAKNQNSTDDTLKALTAKAATPVSRGEDSIVIEPALAGQKKIDSSGSDKLALPLPITDSAAHKKAVAPLVAAHPAPKKTSSSRPAQLASKPDPVTKNDTAAIDTAAQRQENPEAFSDYAKKVKENIMSLVRLTAFEAKTSAAGEKLFAQLKISNRTTFKIDTIIAALDYLSEDSTLFRSENIIFNSIGPFTSSVRQTQVYRKGESIRYRIISVKSKELDLH